MVCGPWVHHPWSIDFMFNISAKQRNAASLGTGFTRGNFMEWVGLELEPDRTDSRMCLKA